VSVALENFQKQYSTLDDRILREIQHNKGKITSRDKKVFVLGYQAALKDLTGIFNFLKE
jgi:hypothetical protein